MSLSGSSSELSLLVGQKQCPQEPVGRVGGGDGPSGDEAEAPASFRGLVLDAGSSKPRVTVGSMWKPPSPRKLGEGSGSVPQAPLGAALGARKEGLLSSRLAWFIPSGFLVQRDSQQFPQLC